MLCSAWFALSLLLACGTSVASDPRTYELYLIDAHRQVGSYAVLDRVVSLMHQAGVRRTILSGRRKVRSADIADFAEQHPDRIVPAIRTKSRAFGDNRRGYYKRLDRNISSGRFRAMAELLLYHAAKGKHAAEFNVAPRDGRIEFALKHAKNNGWPLVMHEVAHAVAHGNAERLWAIPRL